MVLIHRLIFSALCCRCVTEPVHVVALLLLLPLFLSATKVVSFPTFHFISEQGAADGVWTHDKFQDGGFTRRTMRGIGGGVGGATGGTNSTKITVSNLHYGVSDADIIVSCS